MSPKRSKTVPQLVQNYREYYPDLDRDLMRKLIRLENPELFKNNPTNLKALDRWLGKAYKKLQDKTTRETRLPSEQLGKLYNEVIDLRLHPPERVNEDGARYRSQLPFHQSLMILANSHPRFKETYENALRNSQMNMRKPVTQVGDMTNAEIDALLGKLGRVLNEL